MGTGGWGQGGVGVGGIRGVRVGDCVHTHSYVISNPLGLWVVQGGWGGGQWEGERRKLLPRDGFPVSALDFSTTAGSKLSFYADNSIQERLQSCGVPCVNNM